MKLVVAFRAGNDLDDGQVGRRPGSVGRGSSSAAAEADTGRRAAQDHPDVAADAGAGDPALAQAQGAHATAADPVPAAATAPAASAPAASQPAAAAAAASAPAAAGTAEDYGERAVLMECY